MNICGLVFRRVFCLIWLFLELVFLFVLDPVTARVGAINDQVTQRTLRGTRFSEDSIQATLALDYINRTFTNKALVQSKCLTRSAATLGNFSFAFDKSIFSKQFNFLAEQTVLIANTITDILEKSEIKHTLDDSHIKTLYSLWKYTVHNNSQIVGGGIAFKSFFPYVSKQASSSVVSPFENLHKKFNYTDAEFFNILARRNFSNFKSVPSVKVKDGYWTLPYYDCWNTERWIITYSVPFFKPKPNRIPEFRGVVMIDIDLYKTTINQCATDESLFSNSDKCQHETTECKPLPNAGLFYGNYMCVCRKGLYYPEKNSSNKISGFYIESEFLKSLSNSSYNFSGEDYHCLPCAKGCIECTDDSPCMAEYDILLRGIPLGIQSFSVTVTIVIGIVVLRLRKTRVMVAGMWPLLEIILLGAILLYTTVIIQYFEPTTTICIIIPWFREVGFAIVYGALVLKIYRLLAEFQSRKAHRVHVRDKDLLKYLCCVMVVVIGYMSAWTTVTFDHIREGKDIIQTGYTPDDELKYLMCKAGWWEYVIEIAELLFLMFGIYMCYRVRSAPSEYSEGTYVSAAICYEAVISIVYYILRHVYWLELHPDYMFLMSFIRCQLTATVTLVLIFGPKLLFAHRPPDDHFIRNRAYSSSEVQEPMPPEAMKLNVSISSNGDVDVGEVSLADMDPEDIRAELKRLYTQLQIYKTRAMRKDNPHISKKRGGRKQTHRRFSLQPFHHKRHHHSEHDHEVSKTPEESTNSAEAVSVAYETTTANKYEDGHEAKENKKEQCTVTFKMNLK
ncbi:hypothetical protein FSP39_017567 [Pinctada imbricata]|uniref:G-protein coupled receptors family 3 profile domain-containing protein n=1 Tax=Pinctada imbricata TaxID=66713 RepID=A0AA88XDH4_PINIB|nr:hypothetical protein FSP39_017567 [Pinctada imbricata]